MRRRLYLSIALAALGGLAVVAAALAVPTAPNGNTQTIDVKVKPSRLSGTRPTPITLEVTTRTTSTTNPSGVPVPAVKAIIDFDRNTAIFSRGYPTCATGKIVNTSTENALQACRRAKIGGGKARALIQLGSQVFVEDLVVTAFNGQPKGRKPVVLLHSYGRAPVQTTAVLVGAVSRYDKEGYGPRLSLNIPLIAGGAGALTDFNTSIFKRFAYKGVKRSYVTAMCKGKRLKSRGEFVFRDGESLTPRVTQRCTRRS
jgi:hypothetical protein